MRLNSLSKYLKNRLPITVVWLAHSLFLGILLSCCSVQALAQADPTGCLLNLSKGHDYRPERFVPDGTYSYDLLLKLVEDAHFTANVQMLRSSQNGTGKPGPDLAYTLRVYPNHHRALLAMVALGEKERSPQPAGSEYTVECWFARAIAFAPDDDIVRMIYAQYLIKGKRNEEAQAQLDLVGGRAGDNAFTHNNLGLLYFDMKNYEKALFHSHKAFELGLRIPTLRDKLKSVGKWTEPTEAVPVEPAKTPQ